MGRPSWKYRGLVVAGLVLGLALPAQATSTGFQGRLETTSGLMDYQAYYNPHLGITLAADANINNGPMNWSDANAWAAGLTIEGVSGWRLPTCLDNAATSATCSTSEMAYLFTGEGISFASPSPFSNMDIQYWSGTSRPAPFTGSAWAFDVNSGMLFSVSKSFVLFAWAVRSGDVSAPAPIPEPGTMLLMGSGLVGLMGWRRLRRG